MDSGSGTLGLLVGQHLTALGLGLWFGQHLMDFVLLVGQHLMDLVLLVGQHLMDSGFACWCVSLGVWVCLLRQQMVRCGRLAMHSDSLVLKSEIEIGHLGLWLFALQAYIHCMQHACSVVSKSTCHAIDEFVTSLIECCTPSSAICTSSDACNHLLHNPAGVRRPC